MSKEFDDKLMADAAKLTTEIAPERDLWPEIAAEISRPKRRGWVPYVAQAAAVILLVGGSSLITYQLTKSNVSNSPVVTSATFDSEFVSFGDEQKLSGGFESARNSLAAQLDAELDRLSPPVRAEVEANLVVIREAVAEIKAALEEEPNNAMLQELLMDTYREELALMRQVGGLTHSVMSRNDI